jgi:RNA-directed DNA polymerase
MSLETPEKIRKLQRTLYGSAKKDPERRFHQLYDKVYREDIFAHAYRLARSNGGASGVDEMTFEDIETQGRQDWLEGLRTELRTKTYEPSPVRRVMIRKPGGGERPLGIPTIRDRVVQTAAKLVLEPIFEADFEDCAYGYRPKRSAGDAIREVHRAICEGQTDVVDADLSKYFDTIPHSELMQSVARRVVDRHMLRLIKAWLKVPVEERDDRGNRRMTGGKKGNRGTPQGGVISPLLANIYMHRYLKAWKQHGKGAQYRARLVNYADDFVILTRGHAEQALEWTRRVMGAIGLTLNETKTTVCNAREQSFDFLGYTFGPERYRKDGHWYLAAKPSKKSVKRIKERISAWLRPGNQRPREVVVGRLNQILRGWANYFGYGTRLMAYRAVDNYVTERMRGFLRRRHKVGTRGALRFSAEWIFETLGVQRLRPLHVGRPSCAGCETSRGAGCGKTARPVR